MNIIQKIGLGVRELFTKKNLVILLGVFQAYASNCSGGADLQQSSGGANNPKKGDNGKSGDGNSSNLPKNDLDDYNDNSSEQNGKLNNLNNTPVNKPSNPQKEEEQPSKPVKPVDINAPKAEQLSLYDRRYLEKRNFSKNDPRFQEKKFKDILEFITAKKSSLPKTFKIITDILDKKISIDAKQDGRSGVFDMLDELESLGFMYVNNYRDDFIYILSQLGYDFKNAEDKDGNGMLHYFINLYKDDLSGPFLDLFEEKKIVYGDYIFYMNKQNKNGETILHDIFKNGYDTNLYGIFPLILADTNANFSLRDKNGKTIYDLPKFYDLAFAQLEKYGKKIDLVNYVIESTDFSSFKKEEIKHIVQELLRVTSGDKVKVKPIADRLARLYCLQKQRSRLFYGTEDIDGSSFENEISNMFK